MVGSLPCAFTPRGHASAGSCAGSGIIRRELAVTWMRLSRRVVGWSMSVEMTAQLVTDALVMAIWRRGKPDALLHHSDRGSQYTSEQFQKLLADHGVICSMNRSAPLTPSGLPASPITRHSSWSVDFAPCVKEDKTSHRSIASPVYRLKVGARRNTNCRYFVHHCAVSQDG
jgi:hypothetical protein